MTTDVAFAFSCSGNRLNCELEVALPEPGASMDQDAEWCVVRVGDSWRQVRFHNYEEIFSVPGLYEKVIYDILQCSSPQVVTDILAEAMAGAGENLRGRRVLDLGAGNGIVGEMVAQRGAECVVGVDIIEEAAKAAERDRPGVYDDYYVADLTQLSDNQERELTGHRFDCMTCVAALGFGDIPTDVFITAYNLVQPDGWIAFNLKDEFLNGEDSSGFAELVRLITAEGDLDVRCRQRYQHRLGTDREPIHYVAFAGRKRRDVS